jgi:hypothetical protein
MSINSTSLAASQSIYFKDLGRASCHKKPIKAPNYEENPKKWLIFTGARSYKRSIVASNRSKENCFLYVFYNKNNKNSRFFFEDVGYSYRISDKALYNTWVKNKK